MTPATSQTRPTRRPSGAVEPDVRPGDGMRALLAANRAAREVSAPPTGEQREHREHRDREQREGRESAAH